MGKVSSILLLFISFLSYSWAIPNEVTEYHATFSGRISRINNKARLVRVKLDFANSKYITKGNKIEFWSDAEPTKRCSSYVEGKSTEYVLLKIPQFQSCVNGVQLTTGSYLNFYSSDLQRNLNVGRDLLDILLKKRMAIGARVDRSQIRLDTYPDRIETINKRYEVLRQKLELEWQEELQAMEEDKAFTFKNYKSSKVRLDELEHKLEKYKIEDHNLKIDRWSLDPKLFQRK